MTSKISGCLYKSVWPHERGESEQRLISSAQEGARKNAGGPRKELRQTYPADVFR